MLSDDITKRNLSLTVSCGESVPAAQGSRQRRSWMKRTETRIHILHYGTENTNAPSFQNKYNITTLENQKSEISVYQYNATVPTTSLGEAFLVTPL